MLKQTTELIAQDFPLVAEITSVSEAQLIELLAEQIEFLLEKRLMDLMLILYKLDVDEKHIYQALSPTADIPAHYYLAEVVLNRQKKRVADKLKYSDDKGDGSW